MLSEKIDFRQLLSKAEKLEMHCCCCERRCGIDRTRQTGYCGNSTEPLLTKFFITHGEEKILTPSRMVYAAGCNMRCAYCSNLEFIQPERTGKNFDYQRMANEIDDDFRSGRIRCVQLLGGEPTCWLSGAVKLVSHLKSDVPVVWNSNFYFTEDAFEIIREIVDFYVADFKFGNNACAQKIADCEKYIETVTRNILRIKPENLLIRQLPLHGHLECCTRPALEWIARNLPGIQVNFNDLLPNGGCKGLDAKEQKKLEEMIREYKITRIRSVPGDPGKTGDARVCFSGEILLRADGTIAIQDFASPVAELMRHLEIIHEEKDI